MTKVVLWRMGLITDITDLYTETTIFFSLSIMIFLVLHSMAVRMIRVILQGLHELTTNPNYRLEKLPGLWGSVSDKINQLADSIVGTRNLIDKVIGDLPVAVMVADKEGKIKICNPAAKQLFLCQSCDDACNKRCPKKLLEWTFKTNKQVTNYDYYLELSSNENIHLLINTKLISDVKGDGMTVLLTAIDITSKQLMWEQMQQTEKLSMISDLAAGVAHEIKNPLTSARGLMQLINTRFDDEDVARQHIKVAIDSLNRINIIINEMEQLSLSKESNLTFNQLETIMEEVFVLIESDAVFHNVTVTKSYQPQLPLAVIDGIQIKQVFLNLAVNAINAMPKGGILDISINFNANNNEFVIRFTDKGIGMTNDEIKKIFNPFYSSSADNTGLGLSVCHQIIKSHGGNIKVHSEKGKGSIFAIYLPALNQKKTIC
jgi:signal transduction histidine kinase